jgi:hypothetical protein
MRAELAAEVGDLLDNIKPDKLDLTAEDRDTLFALADVITFARTAVETDSRGDVIDAHEPEAPTRFAKQLFQVMRGAMAIGLDHDHARRLAIRCAHDSIPPLRLKLLNDIAANPMATTSEIRHRLNKPLSTVRRQLEGLQVLDLLGAKRVTTENGNITLEWSLGKRLNGTGLHEVLQFNRTKNRETDPCPEK